MTTLTRPTNARGRTKPEFITWWCRCGNEISAREDALEVWCPLAGHRGTNAMKPKHLYPHWGPA